MPKDIMRDILPANNDRIADRFLVRSLICHLARGAALTAGDCEMLTQTALECQRAVPAHFDLIRVGEKPTHVKIVLDGWAIRYRSLSDGCRQILAFLLPGDVCADHGTVLSHMDHSVASLTPVRYTRIPQVRFDSIIATSPRLARAFRWAELVTVSIQREWTLNIGQRIGTARIAHLLYETVVRMRSRGLGGPGVWSFPPRQSEIAEAIGLTPVHVNRLLQQLRHEGLIEWHARELRVKDMTGLKERAMFDPAYLHGTGEAPIATYPFW